MSKSYPILPTALVLLAGISVLAFLYGPRLSTPLIWDDRGAIIFNAELEKAVPWRDFFSEKYFTFSKEATWRPLATFSYYALIHAFGKNPFPLRLILLLAHVLNACLLYAFLSRTAIGQKTALVASACFLLHPAHSETLMCVSFNEEILTAFGILTMLLAHQRGWTLASVLGLSCALLSKEIGIIGLGLLPLYDVAARGTQAMRRHIKIYAVHCAPALIYLWLRFGPLKGPAQSESLPLLERLYYCLGSLGGFGRIFVLPVSLRIEYFALPPGSWFEAIAVAASGLAVAAGLIFLIYHSFKMERLMMFFLAWPVLFWLPVSHLAPGGALGMRLLAERWLYLPSMGAATALARWLPKKWIGLILILWTLCGALRVRDWNADTALWHSLAAVYPWCAKAQEGLGEAYFRVGDWTQALTAFEKSLSLRENRQDKVLAHYAPRNRSLRWESPSLYRWLALNHWKRGGPSKARDFFLKAQNIQPSDGFTYRALAYLCAQQGDWGCSKLWLDKGLTMNPRDGFLRSLEPEVARKRLLLRAQFN